MPRGAALRRRRDGEGRRHHRRAGGRVARSPPGARRARFRDQLMSSADDHGEDRRRGLRGRRPHRRVRLLTLSARHALRGRRPAGGPCGHPRAWTGWPSTPASSCTTRAPTRCCCGCSPSSGSATQPSEMSMSIRDDESGAGVGRSPGPARPVPDGRQPAAAALSADAGRDPALPPVGQAGGLDRLDHHPAGVPRGAAGSRRTSCATSWSRSSPRCGRATPRSRSTTRPATCSRSSSTTACSASSARRSGARSPAARTSTSDASPPSWLRSASAPRSRRCWRPPTGVEITDGNGDVTAYDGVVIATHPAQALSMLAAPTSLQRAVLERPAVLLQHRPAAHRHLAVAEARATPGLRGTSVEARRDHLRPDPAAAPAHRDPLSGHARRRAARRPQPGDRPDGVRAPALQPDLRGRAAPAAGDQHRPRRVRRRLPRLGLPRGRREVGAGCC